MFSVIVVLCDKMCILEVKQLTVYIFKQWRVCISLKKDMSVSL